MLFLVVVAVVTVVVCIKLIQFATLGKSTQMSTQMSSANVHYNIAEKG